MMNKVQAESGMYCHLVWRLCTAMIYKFNKSISSKVGWDDPNDYAAMSVRLKVAADEERWVDVANYAALLFVIGGKD